MSIATFATLILGAKVLVIVLIGHFMCNLATCIGLCTTLVPVQVWCKDYGHPCDWKRLRDTWILLITQVLGRTEQIFEQILEPVSGHVRYLVFNSIPTEHVQDKREQDERERGAWVWYSP
jgi:hypothetical protein